MLTGRTFCFGSAELFSNSAACVLGNRPRTAELLLPTSISLEIDFALGYRLAILRWKVSEYGRSGH